MEHKWLMLSLGWLIYFSFGLIHTAIAPLVAPIMSDLGLTYTQMGVVTGAWQLLYIFTAQPLGFVIDRLGVRRSLLLGASIISASSLLRCFVTGFYVFFASVALFGFGGPLISIGTPKLVSTWFTGEERGTASGINASGSVVGSMMALALTNSLVLPWTGSWRNVFLFYGGFGFLVATLWLLFGKPNNVMVHKEVTTLSRRDPHGGTLRGLLKYRDIWLIVGIGIIFFLTTHALQNWLPRMLELKGFLPTQAGYASSLMTMSGILGSILIPRLSYRLGSKRLMIALQLFVSGLTILLIGVGGGPLLWVGILFTGFFLRALMPLLTLTLMDMPRVGAKHMGVVGGLFFSVGEIGGFLGPFLMGFLKDLTGTFFSSIIFLTLITEATIGAVFFLNLKENE